MKRMLAAGAPDIYQICKVFRDHELGHLHQPEFTLVEWYRCGIDFNEMITETCAFISDICALPPSPVDQFHYRDLFINNCGLDPINATRQQLENCASKLLGSQFPAKAGLNKNDWLDLLLSSSIAPELANDSLTVIHHYPADQAALAKLDPEDADCAQRFEVFYGSIELANGYCELTDADELRQRFDKDNRQRQTAGLPALNPDTFLLAAMEAGLPECCGVAVGFDRLVMTACNLDSISAAISFDH